ncbi:MAG: hypothetical protein R2839_12945 [Thermomicrobiales bacterium]
MTFRSCSSSPVRTGGFQQLVLGLLVAPAVIQVTYQAFRTDQFSAGAKAGEIALRRFPASVGRLPSRSACFCCFPSTIILFPLALYIGVRWSFVAQAVIIDNADMLRSRRRSARNRHRLLE